MAGQGQGLGPNGDGYAWPRWFQQWLNEVYHPQHVDLGDKITDVAGEVKQISAAQADGAQSLQKMSLRQELDDRNRATVVGFIKEWANPVAAITLLVLYLLRTAHG